jgi:hypothetical protein
VFRYIVARGGEGDLKEKENLDRSRRGREIKKFISEAFLDSISSAQTTAGVSTEIYCVNDTNMLILFCFFPLRTVISVLYFSIYLNKGRRSSIWAEGALSSVAYDGRKVKIYEISSIAWRNCHGMGACSAQSMNLEYEKQ